MSDFVTRGDDAKATVQSLLECRRMIRSVIAVTESLEVLANEPTAMQLAEVRKQLQLADADVLIVYKRNAREAFERAIDQEVAL